MTQGRPVYARNVKSPISVCIYAEKFVEYTFNITNNEKYFPKRIRYSVTDRLRQACIKMMININHALDIYPHYKKQYKKRRKYTKKAFKNLREIYTMMLLIISVSHIHNPEHFAEMYTELVDVFERFVRSDKNRYKNLPDKSEYLEGMKIKRINSKLYKLDKAIEYQNDMTELEKYRDNDGFINLKRRTSI